MIKPVVNLVKALSTNTKPGEIAHAFACGILLGFMPKNNLLWSILFVFILFMRIQRSALTLSLILGVLIAPALDNCFNAVGWWVLTQEGAIPTYRRLLDIPFVAFTKFNNTVVMGSLVCGLIAYIPLYWLCRGFTRLWRKYVAGFMGRTKVIKAIKKLPLIEKIADIAIGK